MGKASNISAAGESLTTVFDTLKTKGQTLIGDNVGGMSTTTVSGTGNTVSGLDENETDVLFKLVDTLDKAIGTSTGTTSTSAAVQAAARKTAAAGGTLVSTYGKPAAALGIGGLVLWAIKRKGKK